MLNILNRIQVYSTYSLEKQAQVRDLLADNHIDYQIKTINRTSPSPFASGMRCRTGSFGQNNDLAYEYVFYVHKNDLDKAKHILNLK